MNKDDQRILKAVQKNADMALSAIETMSEKVSNDELLYEISRQRLLYSTIYNKASYRLQNEKTKGYKKNVIEDVMLKSSIHMNTLTNCSTSKIAELMIQGSNKGITSMWKSMNSNSESSSMSMEVAKELVDFEEKCIRKLKRFL